MQVLWIEIHVVFCFSHLSATYQLPGGKQQGPAMGG